MISIVIMLLMGMCAIILALVSVGIIMLGDKIKTHECGGMSSNTLSSPENATKIVVALAWVGFVVSFLLFTSDNTVIIITSIAIIVAVMLMVFTTFIFSMAVLSTMNNKKICGVGI